MKRFRYSLQRVLDIRELAVTQCEAMLAESKRALQARQAEEHQFGSAMRKASDDILSTSTRTPSPPGTARPSAYGSSIWPTATSRPYRPRGRKTNGWISDAPS